MKIRELYDIEDTEVYGECEAKTPAELFMNSFVWNVPSTFEDNRTVTKDMYDAEFGIGAYDDGLKESEEVLFALSNCPFYTHACGTLFVRCD